MAQSSTASVWARGGLVFAATMMIMLGIWQVIMGIAAIAKGEFFVAGPNYVYEVDITAWGWIHLVLGALAAVAGFFLFTGATWARVVGIGVAVLSAINNFFFIPYYPVWSLTVIALNVFVIWALCTARMDTLAEERGMASEMAGYGGMPQTASRPAGSTAGAPQDTAQKWPPANRPGTGGRTWADEKASGAAQTAPPPGSTTAPQPPSTTAPPP